MGAGVVPPLLSMASSKIRTEVREHVSENGLGKLWSEQKRCEKKKRERGWMLEKRKTKMKVEDWKLKIVG